MTRKARILGLAILAVFVIVHSAVAQQDCILGDLDGSGTVDFRDAVTTLRIMIGQGSDTGLVLDADTNADGKIDLIEAIYALQIDSDIRNIDEDPPVSLSLIGSWLCDAEGLEYSAVLTFIDDNNYMFAADGEPDDDGGRGMERGTYNWNSSSGEFTAVAVSNTAGGWGISNVDTNGRPVFISENTLNFDDSISGVIQFTKISSDSNPIIGGWLFDELGLEYSAVLTFIDESNYMFAVDGEPDDDGGRGMERGTYNWNSSSGEFTAVAVSNTAGGWGISNVDTNGRPVFIIVPVI